MEVDLNHRRFLLPAIAVAAIGLALSSQAFATEGPGVGTTAVKITAPPNILVASGTLLQQGQRITSGAVLAPRFHRLIPEAASQQPAATIDPITPAATMQSLNARTGNVLDTPMTFNSALKGRLLGATSLITANPLYDPFGLSGAPAHKRIAGANDFRIFVDQTNRRLPALSLA